MKKEKHIHGFKTPKDYFEDFETDLFQKMDLETLPKESGFQVPENYFDTLEDKIFLRYNASEKQPKVISLFRRKETAYIAAIAASIALIFSVVTFTNDETTFNSIELTNLENYIEEGNLEWDSEDVIALLDDDQVSNLNFSEDLFTEENLETYLLENIDETALLNE